MRCTVPVPTPHSRATLRNLAGAQLRVDAFFDGGIDFRPAELLPLCDRVLEAGVHARRIMLRSNSAKVPQT
jgi:hypothetical protein